MFSEDRSDKDPSLIRCSWEQMCSQAGDQALLAHEIGWGHLLERETVLRLAATLLVRLFESAYFLVGRPFGRTSARFEALIDWLLAHVLE